MYTFFFCFVFRKSILTLSSMIKRDNYKSSSKAHRFLILINDWSMHLFYLITFHCLHNIILNCFIVVHKNIQHFAAPSISNSLTLSCPSVYLCIYKKKMGPFWLGSVLTFNFGMWGRFDQFMGPFWPNEGRFDLGPFWLGAVLTVILWRNV